MAEDTPAIPTAMHPAEDASGVDVTSQATLFEWSAIAPASSLATAVEDVDAQNDLTAAVAGGTGKQWEIENELNSPLHVHNEFLVAPNFDQEHMAKLVVYGGYELLDFDGISFSTAPSTATLSDVAVRIGAMGKKDSGWTGEFGDSFVRVTIAWDGVFWREFYHSLSATEWAGGAVAIPADAFQDFSIHALLEEKLGHPYTIADVETIGTLLQVSIQTWTGRPNAEHVGEFHVARVVLRATYHSGTTAPAQSAYQVQVSSDGVTWTGGPLVYDGGKLVGSSGRFHSDDLSESLAGLTAYWWRVQVWNVADVASGYQASPNSFTTMARSASLLRAEGSPQIIADWFPGVWTIGPDWTFTSNAKIYKYRLDPDEQVYRNFRVNGLTERVEISFPQAVFDVTYSDYLEVFTFAEVALGERRFFWDHDDVQGEGAGHIYIRPTDMQGQARHPGGFRAGGIMIDLHVGLSTDPIESGDQYQTFYAGRIDKLPSFQRGLQDLHSGRAVQISGTMQIDNRPESGETIGPFSKLLTYRPPLNSGWIIDDRLIRFRAVGATREGRVSYSDGPIIAEGKTRFPKGGFELDGAIPIIVRPLEVDGHEKQLGLSRWDTTMYPSLVNRDGDPVPEVYGVDSGGIYEIAIIDGAVNNEKLDPGRDIDSIVADQLYYGDDIDNVTQVVELNQWTWSSTNEVIAIDTAYSATFQTLIGKKWFCRAVGEGGSSYPDAGSVARKMLEDKMGIAAASIVTSTFDLYTAAVRYLVTSPTRITELLRRAQQDGMFHVAARIDGQWAAEPLNPTTLGDNWVELHDYEIIGAPGWRVDLSRVASQVDLKSPPGGGIDARALVNTPKWNHRVKPIFGREITREVMLDDPTGALAADIVEKMEQPSLQVDIKCNQRGLYSVPATRVALHLIEALDPTGELEWGLMKVLAYKLVSKDEVELTLEWQQQLATEARPVTGGATP